MPARSGGRYEVRNGRAVLIERSGYQPEAEAKPAKKPDTPAKSATPQESHNADA